MIEATPQNLIDPRRFSILDARAQLHGSLLLFIQTFYRILTGRDFLIANPIGRESPQITVCRQLTRLFNLEIDKLVLNLPPGHGKSTMICYFIAWAISQYADCNHIYASYSKELATKCTFVIKQIMMLSQYRDIFEVEIRKDSSAKDEFTTHLGGCTVAVGTEGTITGRDAGLQGVNRYSGGLFIDDAHKPDEVHSDTVRERVINNYNRTLKNRLRSPTVAACYMGHRLREEDLPDFLLQGKDGYHWDRVVLEELDENNHALNPNVRTTEMLLREKEFNPYVFWSMHQQNPQPAGGGIFQKSWFPLLEEDPEILATFITCDTAETDKEWNDATALSFWGIYKIKQNNVQTDELGLHLLHCIEKRVEPKDLQPLFWDFYATCRSYSVKPEIVTIEAKSSGATLYSVLQDVPGLQVIKILRTVGEAIDKDARRSPSKITRLLSMQRFVASKRMSLPKYGKHTELFLDHMRKLTANGAHAHDDLGDTAYDAYKCGIVDGIILPKAQTNTNLIKNLSNNTRMQQKIVQARWKL